MSVCHSRQSVIGLRQWSRGSRQLVASPFDSSVAFASTSCGSGESPASRPCFRLRRCIRLASAFAFLSISRFRLAKVFEFFAMFVLLVPSLVAGPGHSRRRSSALYRVCLMRCLAFRPLRGGHRRFGLFSRPAAAAKQVTELGARESPSIGCGRAAPRRRRAGLSVWRRGSGSGDRFEIDTRLPINFSIARSSLRWLAEQNEIAVPSAPARPVRPIRWT